MTIAYMRHWYFTFPQRDGYYARWAWWLGPFLVLWGVPEGAA